MYVSWINANRSPGDNCFRYRVGEHVICLLLSRQTLTECPVEINHSFSEIMS
jgi:hypothetical protein